MISSFWNLCRACPSVPVEKLHSEYRSTFQWHEFVSSSKTNAAGLALHHHHTVVRQPTVTIQPNASTTGQGEGERRGKRGNINNINNLPNNWWLTSSTDHIRASQRPQNHSYKERSKPETQLPSEESGSGSGAPRKSLSMGTIRAFDSIIPLQTHQLTQLSESTSNNNADSGIRVANMDMSTKGAQDSLDWTENRGYPEQMSSSYDAQKTLQLDESKIKRKEYKSEYKKQFRPFSQYEYVDGKFFKKKGDQDTNPWYKEVIELRKKAGEYRYRGWGTELGPPHLAEAYHQNVWDQVSKRSSLAALALITTTTKKSISKEEKDKENARKSLPKRSSSRPNTATPKHPISDLKAKDSDTVQGPKKKYEGPPSAASRAAVGKARSQSAGPSGRSPRKAHHSLPPKERDVLDMSKPLPRHPRPTTLATSPRPKASSDKGQRDVKLVKTLQFDKSSADPMGFSEPVIKSPPEPTRVKSPEQVIMSPDPVNWTVPLDTTKSFTVTQNIRDAPPSPRFRAGELRPHGVESRSGHHQLSGSNSSSSTKASSSVPSVPSRSAGQAQTHKNVSGPSIPSRPQTSGNKTGGSSASVPAKSTLPVGERKKVETTAPSRNLNGLEGSQKGVPVSKLDNRKPGDDRKNNNEKPTTATKTVDPFPKKLVPGTTLQCLEDPQFMFDPPKTTSQQQTKPLVPIATTHSFVPYDSSSKVSSPPPLPAPRGTIRVLEAPTGPTVLSPEQLGFVPPAPVSVAKIPTTVGSSQVSDSIPNKASQPQSSKLPQYKVLDAPDPSELYKSSPTSTTTAASKSKHKFDFKFWGKSKDNEHK